MMFKLVRAMLIHGSEVLFFHPRFNIGHDNISESSDEGRYFRNWMGRVLELASESVAQEALYLCDGCRLYLNQIYEHNHCEAFHT